MGSEGITSNTENIFFAVLDINGNKIIGPVRIPDHGYCGCVTAYPPNISWNGSEYGVAWIDVQLNEQGIFQGNYLRLVTLDTSGATTSDQMIRREDGVAGLTWTGSVNGWTFNPSHTTEGNVTTSSGNIYFNSQSISNELISTVSGSNSLRFLIWADDHFAVVWVNVQNNQSQLYFGTK